MSDDRPDRHINERLGDPASSWPCDEVHAEGVGKTAIGLIAALRSVGYAAVAWPSSPAPLPRATRRFVIQDVRVIDVGAGTAAVIDAARCAGLDAGSIAVGKWADFVLLDADPSADIGNARRIRAVFLAGRLGNREGLAEPSGLRAVKRTRRTT